MSLKLVLAAAFVAAGLPFALATADDRPPPRKPPQGAIDACANLTQGTACTVTFKDHTMSGTCETFPDGGEVLACRPDHPPGPPPQR